jgi:hypothetical protein
MGRSLEDLLRMDSNLTPAVGNQSVNGGAVDALLEPRPPDSGCAHRTRLAVGVET